MPLGESVKGRESKTISPISIGLAIINRLTDNQAADIIDELEKTTDVDIRAKYPVEFTSRKILAQLFKTSVYRTIR